MTFNSSKLLFSGILIALSFTTVAQNKDNVNINFTKFDVAVKNKKVAIGFSTDKAIETNYFEIQKSIDGVNFRTIALILGPDPKQEGDNYAYNDKLENTKAKQSYYRAKHISTDGIAQYSEPRLLSRNL